MQIEGAVDRKGKALANAGALPPVVLADVVTRDRDGDLVAKPTEWDEEDLGKPPRISVHFPRKPRPGMAVPGIGDRVLLRIEPDREGGYHGRLIKVLAKSKAQVFGVYRALPGGGGRLAPIDKKSLGREVPIPIGDENGAQDGDLVAVSLASQGRFGLTLGKVINRLGSLKTEKAISLVAIISHGIPQEFSPAAARGSRGRAARHAWTTARTGAICR